MHEKQQSNDASLLTFLWTAVTLALQNQISYISNFAAESLEENRGANPANNG